VPPPPPAKGGTKGAPEVELDPELALELEPVEVELEPEVPEPPLEAPLAEVVLIEVDEVSPVSIIRQPETR
jgi:hypothetical protein